MLFFTVSALSHTLTLKLSLLGAPQKLQIQHVQTEIITILNNCPSVVRQLRLGRSLLCTR